MFVRFLFVFDLLLFHLVPAEKELSSWLSVNSDLMDEPNRNRIESESGKESKRDINISVKVIEQNTSESFACMCETHFDKTFVQ